MMSTAYSENGGQTEDFGGSGFDYHTLDNLYRSIF